MRDLNTLINIGNTSAFWLKTVGINSYEELETAGAASAYVDIQQFGIKTSKTLLTTRSHPESSLARD